MTHSCSSAVTHVGEKGYIYCAVHAVDRRGVERTRKMKPWELRLIQRGVPLPSYEPINQKEYLDSQRAAFYAEGGSR